MNMEKDNKKKNQSKTETKSQNNVEGKKKTSTKKQVNKASDGKNQKKVSVKETTVIKNVEKEIEITSDYDEIEELEPMDNIEVEEDIDEIASKKKVKKSDLILIIALIIVVILGFVFMQGKKVEPSYELPLTLTGEAGLHELSYAEYQEKIDNNESFVVIIERATCSHCVNFMPVAEAFAKDNNVPMYYVDTDTFSDEDWEGFEKSNTFLKKNSGNWGTPTTVVLAGNEAVDYIEGETTSDNLLELYNEYFDNDTE